MSFKYRSEPRVALTTVGDGGFTAGRTTRLNMASLYQAPFVLIVEDNKYAYSTPLDQQMRSPDFAAKAAANDIPSSWSTATTSTPCTRRCRTAIDRARRAADRPSSKPTRCGCSVMPSTTAPSTSQPTCWRNGSAGSGGRHAPNRLLDEGVTTAEALDAIDPPPRPRSSERSLRRSRSVPGSLHPADGVYA
jgi:hypothetical protein